MKVSPKTALEHRLKIFKLVIKIDHHAGDRMLFVCLSCNTTFESKKELSSHVQTTHELSCYFCKKEFHSKHALSWHIKRHYRRSKFERAMKTESKGNMLKSDSQKRPDALKSCTICDKAFRTARGLKRHIQLHTKLHQSLLGTSEAKLTSLYHRFFMNYHKHFMANRQILQRKDCVNAVQKYYRDLHYHKKYMDSKTRCYKFLTRCSFCPKVCHTIATLKLHTATHKSLKCSICGKTLSTSVYSKLHYKMHEVYKNTKKLFKEQMTTLGTSKSSKGNRNSGNPCPICKKSFSSRSCLNRHQRVHTGEKPYECQECGEEFRERIVLNKHMVKHTGIPLPKKHKCEVCGKAFALSSVLQHHMRGHGEKSLQCSYCGKKFSHKKLLCRHEMTHSSEKQFVCKVCGKSFLTNHNMQRHAKIHTNEKPFKCEWCSKVFRQSGNLKTHERIHTKEKPYGCETCGRRFTQSANLKHHMLLHTGKREFPGMTELQHHECILSEGGASSAPSHSSIPLKPEEMMLSKVTNDTVKMPVDEADSSSYGTRYTQKSTIRCLHCRRSFPDARDFLWHDCTQPHQENLHIDIMPGPASVAAFEGTGRVHSSSPAVSVPGSSPLV